jgi:hypothetical protein
MQVDEFEMMQQITKKMPKNNKPEFDDMFEDSFDDIESPPPKKPVPRIADPTVTLAQKLKLARLKKAKTLEAKQLAEEQQRKLE